MHPLIERGDFVYFALHSIHTDIKTCLIWTWFIIKIQSKMKSYHSLTVVFVIFHKFVILFGCCWVLNSVALLWLIIIIKILIIMRMITNTLTPYLPFVFLQIRTKHYCLAKAPDFILLLVLVSNKPRYNGFLLPAKWLMSVAVLIRYHLL